MSNTVGMIILVFAAAGAPLLFLKGQKKQPVKLVLTWIIIGSILTFNARLTELSTPLGKLKMEAEQKLEEIEDIRADIEGNSRQIKDMSIQARKDIKGISSSLSILEERNNILQLADRAIIAGGDAGAFDTLVEFADHHPDENVRDLALAEMNRVKGFWLAGTRLKGKWVANKTGALGIKKSVPISELGTAELLHMLQVDPLWQARAHAAVALHIRKERGVPEKLLQAIKEDQSLCVRKHAIMAFSVLVDIQPKDVFEYYEELNEWWIQNSEAVIRRFDEDSDSGSE